MGYSHFFFPSLFLQVREGNGRSLESSLLRLKKKCKTAEGLKEEQHNRNIVICDRGRIDRCAKDLIDRGVLIGVTENWASDSISNFLLMKTEDYPVRRQKR